MMATLFIADLHLDEQLPAITAGFVKFLHNEARYADALYILGDLFEVWIGDDEPSSLHQYIASELFALKQQGVPCYFIHGNRDFLIGQRFAEQSGLILLPELKVIQPYKKKIVILHGDTLCTDDQAYQRFRQHMYNRFYRKIFGWLPLILRRMIANKLRNRSQHDNQYKSAAIMDVNQNAVVATLEQAQCQLMIHGHTHKPAIHCVNLPSCNAVRIVLGAWHQEGSMVKLFDDDSYQLLFFPL